jgi:hypothetical protein
VLSHGKRDHHEMWGRETVVYPMVSPTSSCKSATIGSLRGGIGMAIRMATSAWRGAASSNCEWARAIFSTLMPGGEVKNVVASTCTVGTPHGHPNLLVRAWGDVADVEGLATLVEERSVLEVVVGLCGLEDSRTMRGFVVSVRSWLRLEVMIRTVKSVQAMDRPA